MAKAQSPLLGYNTNVRHKGKVFHIQTEDSGILKPHVMTHLFADGGRILKSQKTSYAHLLDADDVAALVKKLMQDQHKAMFLALRSGQFDEMAGVAVAEAASPAADPVEPDLPTGETDAVAPAAPTPLNPSQALVVPPPPPRSNLPPAPPLAASAPPPLPMVTPLAASTPPVAASAPPPLPVAMPPSVPAAPPPVPATPSPPLAMPALAPRPALFGDSLVTERSLDEVILAFLAEELETPRAP